MEVKDLCIKEPKKPTPSESGPRSEITSELLKGWAVDICKGVLEKDESMSSGEE